MSAVSSGTLETSVNPNPLFSFSNDQFVSLTTLLTAADHDRPTVGNGLGDRISTRTGNGVPKFKSVPPPSLALSPPSGATASPSFYFSLPHGLSPSELLDSPVLLSASNILACPTTGSVSSQDLNWNNKDSERSKQKDINDEEKSFPEFSFQTQSDPFTSSYGQHKWGYQESTNLDLASESNSMHSNDRNIDAAKSDYNQYNQPSHTLKDYNKKSDDGYNWRKYGQKLIKGSDNPRSYYKCTCPNCPAKKKVERSLTGHITETVISGAHNHPKPPQSGRRSSPSSSSAASASSVVVQTSCSTQSGEVLEQSYGSCNNNTGKMDCFAATPEDSSIFIDDLERRKSGVNELGEDEPGAKRWKGENESEGISGMGSGRTEREARVVVETMSDVDILDDGYRWRKYGQKVVKGNPNPRSYYKCTSRGCRVRKLVERACHDARTVITMYEGKHNHDIPPPRIARNNFLSRTTNMPYVTLPHNSARPQDSKIQAGSYSQYSRFGNSTSCCIGPCQDYDTMFPSGKDEPRDEVFF